MKKISSPHCHSFKESGYARDIGIGEDRVTVIRDIVINPYEKCAGENCTFLTLQIGPLVKEMNTKLTTLHHRHAP